MLIGGLRRVLNARRSLEMHGKMMSSHHSKGYQSIGSFHSENPEVLIKQSDSDYHAPILPFEAKPISTDFLLDRKTWTFLNHGAFGAALKCGHERASQWRGYLEEQPLRFFDRDLLPHLAYSARRLANLTNADRSGIALLPNVTSGLNTAISGYVKTYGGDAKILLWDVGYGSMKKMSRTYCDNVHEIPFQQDYLGDGIDDEDVILKALDEALESGENWTNALFIVDHTTSNTALNLPIEKLCRKAKNAGMITLVDGAHGLLAQEVNFQSLPSIDIYLSNGHKWLSCPRGVAMMYCPHEEIRESLLRIPACMSHGVDDGYFNRFLWDGCRDYAAHLSVPAVLDVWETADPQIIQSWMRQKLVDAVRIIAEKWHPSYSEDIESWPGNVTLGSMDLHGPMALVKLPPTMCGSLGVPKTSTDAKAVQDFLFDHHIEVPAKCINGILYLRISCHIYNELKEFDRLAHVLLDFRTR